jgi:hypothetical protein
MHLPIMIKKLKLFKKIFLFSFIGFSIFFIVILFFMTVHDTMTGISSNTTEYCAKYGLLASPDCW